ncbi:AAA domain-containing protein [Rossellomorea sp. YZS02]|uniref:AAA domain-containing protein n=1 Tax=Rossellomorea sp. YZS02 TaxID=3097358 RepID=UPI002A0D8BF8|nr:AAA domain-containing protein [Rossellomorea sp. YZS02]MDX8344333.1 AAA domain-containing protein [Rossellomorea sp. YZS02]
MKTKDMIEEWQTALDMEILQLKKSENNGMPIEEGRCIRKDEGAYIYWFTLHYPASLPEGGSIVYKRKNSSYQGVVISSEERECIIELDQFPGDVLTYGHILHAPWDILLKLMERLDEAKERHGKTLRIEGALHPDKNQRHPSTNYKTPLHEAYVRSKYNPVTYLWGPPGTGKTYTLARVAAYHYSEGKRVLILSHSNAAVDVLIEEMHRFLNSHNRWVPGDVIRYGANRKDYSSEVTDLSVLQLLEQQDPSLSEEKGKVEMYRRRLKNKLAKSYSSYDSERLSQLEVHYQKIKETFKRREGDLVSDAKVIGTTLSKAAIDRILYEDEFDLVIVDEASMAYVPQVAFAATLGKKIVICGDFKQLPPISTSFHPMASKWLKEDIFHSAGVAGAVEKGHNPPHLLLLPEQRRMHPSISAFTNQYIYRSRVGDHHSVKAIRESITNKNPFAAHGAVLFSLTEGTEWAEVHKGSRWNALSSLVTIQLILQGLNDGLYSIGIVTPYRVQAQWYNLLLDELVKKSFPSVEVYAATVHGFQGSENDMILFDLVDGISHGKPGTLISRKGSERLINVAVTRARGKFILVGNDRFIQEKTSASKPVHQLISHLQQEGLTETSTSLSPTSTKKMKWFPSNHYKKMEKDIKAAVHQIILNVNDIHDIPKGMMEALLEASWDKSVIIHSQYSINLQSASKIIVKPSITSIPFIAIDQKVIWFHTLSEKENSFPFNIRILSKKITARFFKMVEEK